MVDVPCAAADAVIPDTRNMVDSPPIAGTTQALASSPARPRSARVPGSRFLFSGCHTAPPDASLEVNLSCDWRNCPSDPRKFWSLEVNRQSGRPVRTPDGERLAGTGARQPRCTRARERSNFGLAHRAGGARAHRSHHGPGPRGRHSRRVDQHDRAVEAVSVPGSRADPNERKRSLRAVRGNPSSGCIERSSPPVDSTASRNAYARKDVTDRCFSSHPGTTNVFSNSHWTNPKKYCPISLLKVVCLGHDVPALRRACGWGVSAARRGREAAPRTGRCGRVVGIVGDGDGADPGAVPGQWRQCRVRPFPPGECIGSSTRAVQAELPVQAHMADMLETVSNIVLSGTICLLIRG